MVGLGGILGSLKRAHDLGSSINKIQNNLCEIEILMDEEHKAIEEMQKLNDEFHSRVMQILQEAKESFGRLYNDSK